MPTGPDRALAAAADAHRAQADVNARWAEDGLPAFGLGLGLSTGEAAAALLGSEERLEYTLVGDTVNLSQRLQQLADSGETVVSQATMDALAEPVEATLLPEQLVKGRDTPVRAWRIARQVPPVAVLAVAEVGADRGASSGADYGPGGGPPMSGEIP
jgi:class 3 adenylate cyclase